MSVANKSYKIHTQKCLSLSGLIILLCKGFLLNRVLVLFRLIGLVWWMEMENYIYLFYTSFPLLPQDVFYGLSCHWENLNLFWALQNIWVKYLNWKRQIKIFPQVIHFLETVWRLREYIFTLTDLNGNIQ